MYHRILPKREIKPWIQSGMYVHPETLNMHLEFLRQYFNIQPLKTLCHSDESTSSKPRCILTFDDGWRDFQDYGYSVLQQHYSPATVFLPTSFIDTNKWFWTDRLGYILFYIQGISQLQGKITKGPIKDLLYTILQMRGPLIERIERSIALLKKYSIKLIEQVLDSLEESNMEIAEKNRTFLTWSEVLSLKNSGLISFGSHTVNHNILTNLDNNIEVEEEIFASKNELIRQKAVDDDYVSFCYPNGNYNLSIKEKVAKEYSLACTTEFGSNGLSYDPFSLRRIAIHEDMTKTKGLLGCRILGIF